MRRSRSWREPGASTGYVPAVNDSDHWENTRRTVRGEAVQPPVVRAQTTRHSLAARDLDAGGPSAARGRQPTTFLQQDEAGQERQARVVRRGRFRKFRLLILFMSLLGIGFLFATPRGGVSGFGRRSNQYVQHIVEKGKSWTATQLEFVQRWQYGMQLFDLYSAVRRGQWPASSVGAPRRASGRRVFLRDVQSGHYVRARGRARRREGWSCLRALREPLAVGARGDARGGAREEGAQPQPGQARQRALWRRVQSVSAWISHSW